MATDSTDDPQELDVRGSDGDPFDRIMGALSDLEPGESLRLINSFEPVPLYDVLSQRGFEHETEQVAEDEWHVLIEHE